MIDSLTHSFIHFRFSIYNMRARMSLVMIIFFFINFNFSFIDAFVTCHNNFSKTCAFDRVNIFQTFFILRIVIVKTIAHNLIIFFSNQSLNSFSSALWSIQIRIFSRSFEINHWFFQKYRNHFFRYDNYFCRYSCWACECDNLKYNENFKWINEYRKINNIKNVNFDINISQSLLCVMW